MRGTTALRKPPGYILPSLILMIYTFRAKLNCRLLIWIAILKWVWCTLQRIA